MNKKQYFKQIFALILFGSNGIVASRISLSSYQIVLFRTLIGSLFLLLLFLLKRQKFSFMNNKKDFLFIALSGVSMGVSWMFLYEAYAQMGVSIATLLYYSGPVFVMIISTVVFKEKLRWFKLAGFIAVFCGIICINANVAKESVNAFGIFCALMSAVTYAALVVLNKKAKKISGMENALVQMIFSFITVAAFVAFKSGFNFKTEKSEWIWIILLGVVNTGFGCYLYFSSIGKIPVQSVAVCGYLEPFSAVIFSALLLGEALLPLQILGACLILGGALFAECFGFIKGKKKKCFNSKACAEKHSV